MGTDLAALEVRNPLGGAAPMTPAFDAATDEYRAWVPNAADTVAIAATAADGEAAVEISDGTDTVTAADADLRHRRGGDHVHGDGVGPRQLRV